MTIFWPLRFAIVFSLLVISACHWETRAEQDRSWIKEREPRPFELGDGGTSGSPRILKLRVFADEGYRANEPLWRERFPEVISLANPVVRSWFGVEFAIVSLEPWNRSGADESDFVELEQLADDGADWVVGLVKPLTGEQRWDDDAYIGRAPHFGKQLIIRTTLYRDQIRDWVQGLDAMPAIEVWQAYARMMVHSDTTTFFHEWGHSLGAPHIDDPYCIMRRGGLRTTSRFCEPDAQIIRLGLTHFDQARHDASAMSTWAREAEAILNRQPEWSRVSKADRERVIQAGRAVATRALAETNLATWRDGGTLSPQLESNSRPADAGVRKLSRAEISDAALRASGLIRYCWEKFLASRQPANENLVKLRFVIDSTGRPRGLEAVENSTKSSDFEECLKAQVASLLFSPPADGGHFVVTYPFVFRLAGSD